MKTLTINEAEATELLILVRKELEELDKLFEFSQHTQYESSRQRRIEIMNSLNDKLIGEKARADET